MSMALNIMKNLPVPSESLGFALNRRCTWSWSLGLSSSKLNISKHRVKRSNYSTSSFTSRSNSSSATEKENHRESCSLVNRNFLTLKDFTNDEVKTLLWTAFDLKKRIKDHHELYQPLKGKNLAMIFEKRSTRTRMSTESGFASLGGHPIFLSSQDIHLGVNENLSDSARVISRFSDIILARVYSNKTLQTLAKDGSKPVVNGLCDVYHPLQILADFQTLHEHYGQLKGLNIAWVGDGNNNVTHSFLMGCPKMGMNLRVASPKGYEVDKLVALDADALCKENNTTIHYTNDPREAVESCDVIVTDTWVSMGAEEEKAKRLADFHGYQVTQALCSLAKPDYTFLHCLPRKSEEVSDEVFYSRHSLVWDEAENRKWTVMSVLHHLLMDYNPVSPMPKF
ncbi:OTC [Bugula neritina]|uniref:ornithine carbamoyltransferase n=1 Tax=Bugula neritina TaxID=10212 RepID=A0A7J7JNN7_BUGNE|nr:OTC [Bugula neritina]